MKSIKYNKLIRDKIPEIIKKKGAVPEVSCLSDANFIKELKKKLIEEAQEVQGAKNKKDLLNEIVDVLEILMNIAKIKKFNWKNIENKRKIKKLERGGFNKKLFLKQVQE
ncbi:MAG: nucleoside triphosphate pyrophosphohydrolase [bacterium]